MAFGRPPILTHVKPNPVLGHCNGIMHAARDRLSRIELAFQLREVLTSDDIAEAQAELLAVEALLSQLKGELAHPGSGVRIKGGQRIVA